MDKWLIMEESVLATVEFLGLVGYEVLTAYAMKAFWPMNQKKKIIYLFWALLPLALMTMFHSENIGNDTRALMALRWTLRGMIILSPFLQTLRIMDCTAEVVPFTMKKA